jgi:diacylglycerol kinase family enzyme
MVVTLFKRERPDNLKLVKHWQGKDISVYANPEQTVQCDGEVLGKMPLHIRIIPGAIKVVVPAKKDEVTE